VDFFQDAINDPKIYVQTILEVHRKFNALVITAFNNDSGFVASLDKACGKLPYLFSYRLRKTSLATQHTL
jgi:hypothetical protein